MPCTKFKHETEEKANKLAEKLRNKKNTYFRTYYCYDCSSWHLTSQGTGDYLKRKRFR